MRSGGGGSSAAPVKPVKNPDGSTTTTKTDKKAGAVTVTIPMTRTPKAGEVAVLVGTDGTRAVVKRSVPTDGGMDVTLTEGASLEIRDNSKVFSDVGEDDWFRDAVAFASSRAEVATILQRLICQQI